MSKYRLKKDANELQEYLQFRRRGSRVESVKGKGSKYKRSREKDKARKQFEEWYRGCSVMASTRVLGTCRGVRVPHLLPDKWHLITADQRVSLSRNFACIVPVYWCRCRRTRCSSQLINAYVAQMVRASDSYPEGQWFDSTRRYHENLIFLENRGIIFIQGWERNHLKCACSSIG